MMKNIAPFINIHIFLYVACQHSIVSTYTFKVNHGKEVIRAEWKFLF